jgi:hypothetical protein
LKLKILIYLIPYFKAVKWNSHKMSIINILILLLYDLLFSNCVDSTVRLSYIIIY